MSTLTRGPLEDDSEPTTADDSATDSKLDEVGNGAERVADELDDAVDEHPWIERITSVGWIAKGIVYTLMGITAIEISRQGSPSGDASPEGSIARIAAAPLGRASLMVIAGGLALYVVWRLSSVAVIRGHGVAQWADRIGYGFSAAFYAVLCWTSAAAAYRGDQPAESSEIERLSSAVLDPPSGRVIVGVAGVAIIAIGLYFAVHKGVQRSFTDDLHQVDGDPALDDQRRAAIVVAGVAGWIGRGVVTMLVGFFVLRSAIMFEPDDARGFDRSLRAVAGSTLGATFVFVCGVGLVLYGGFCLASHRRRRLQDTS